MTTAHRPTWNTAKGGGGKNESDLSKISQQYSSRDMPGETKLKYRQPGQSATEEVRSKDMRRDLAERERAARRERVEKEKGVKGDASYGGKKPRLDQITSGNLDADDPIEEESSGSESEDEDDEAELMAELARIKKERAIEKAKEDAKIAEQQERIRTENILRGNPLINDPTSTAKSDFQVKRRWDDDVVFKNCAKGLDERAKKPSFVNDAIRSEFHRKFMEKYIQ